MANKTSIYIKPEVDRKHKDTKTVEQSQTA